MTTKLALSSVRNPYQIPSFKKTFRSFDFLRCPTSDCIIK